MNSKKVFFAMIGLVSILAVVAFLVIIVGNSSLKNQSKKLMDAKLKQKTLVEQQTMLVKAKKDLEQYKDLEKLSKTVVPQDKDQARAVREIVKIARQSGISIEAIGFPASSLGSKAPTAAPQSGSSSSPSSAEQSTPQKPKTSPLTQATPVVGIDGVYSIEMIITPEAKAVNYYTFLDFLSRLENNRRTAHVKKITISPESTKKTSPNVEFGLTLNVFVKP